MQTGGFYEIYPPMYLNAGIEADFEIGGPLTPFVGADANVYFGSFRKDGHDISDSYSGDFLVTPYVGLRFAITPTINVEAAGKVTMGSEDIIGDHNQITADMHFNFNF